jgi:GrpB-like predicted nucleotidyltransferase (UPF0157 family)
MGSDPVEFVDEREVRERVLGVFDDLCVALRALLPDADIQHVGSTSVPGAITKGDLDVCIGVERAAFENADRVLGEHFARNVGSDRTASFSSFVDDGRPIPVGVQLVVRGGHEDFFVRWRDLLRESPRVSRAYNDLKRRWRGQSHDSYREAKSTFVERELGLADMPRDVAGQDR